jgi:hypothetical protein
LKLGYFGMLLAGEFPIEDCKRLCFKLGYFGMLLAGEFPIEDSKRLCIFNIDTAIARLNMATVEAGDYVHPTCTSIETCLLPLGNRAY